MFEGYSVEVTNGPTEICRYSSAVIRGGDESTPVAIDIDVVRHLPMYVPGMGPHFVQSDAYGPIRWGSRTGWEPPI